MPISDGRVEDLKAFADTFKDMRRRMIEVSDRVQATYEGRSRADVFAADSQDVRAGTLHNFEAVLISSMVFTEATVDLAERGALPERLEFDVHESDIGVIIDDAVMPTIRWGSLYRWWNEYESGLRAVLGALQGRAPHNAKDIPAAIRKAAVFTDHADWEDHFELCRALRNLGHNADRYNPAWNGGSLSWRGRTVRFESGVFPEDLNSWPHWTHETFLAAVQFWGQAVISESVIAIEGVIQ